MKKTMSLLLYELLFKPVLSVAARLDFVASSPHPVRSDLRVRPTNQRSRLRLHTQENKE